MARQSFWNAIKLVSLSLPMMTLAIAGSAKAETAIPIASRFRLTFLEILKSVPGSTTRDLTSTRHLKGESLAKSNTLV